MRQLKPIPPRPLSDDEAAVLRAALRLSARSIGDESAIEGLTVHGVCDCGCRSVFFDPLELGDERSFDGCGTTPNGRMVEVLVWSHDHRICALDIVDYESTGLLPTAQSIRPWDRASERT